jgi:CheY-like chemotaxis protein
MTTNILVAGKALANVNLIKEAVDHLDYQVIPAPSMSLALFLTHKNLPELVICDAEMVDGDPGTFLREMQSDEELRQIPFMLMTSGELDEKARRKLMTEGAALILCGQMSSAELFATIQPYIKARLERKEDRVTDTAE